ncbi:ferrochelatase [Sporosarcina koreensis]|uniref:ferrochelatase n=1 Tax=Sporosarcina koreensis TaxID=334735 RepID=UPI000752B9DA|nr:ferrochelatase [Sporosarcina koreensis]
MNAVILFSYGHLTSIDDLEPFYKHLLRKHYSEASLERGKELFKSLGTPDSLTSITKRIGRALSKQLSDQTGEQWMFYIGAKHSPPFVEDAVQQCAMEGVTRILTVPLTPLASITGTKVYEREVEKAAEGTGIDVLHLGAYGGKQLFVDVLVTRLYDAIEWLPQEVKGQTTVVFTAHSMPGVDRVHSEFIEQYKTLASSLCNAAGVEDYRIAYRSGGPSPQKWLGPDVLEVIADEADEGRKAIVACELLSIIANAEVIQEIGREAKQFAHSRQMDFVQTDYLNDGFDFVECLAVLCAERLETGKEMTEITG